MYYNINHSAGKIKLKNGLNVLKLFFFYFVRLLLVRIPPSK